MRAGLGIRAGTLIAGTAAANVQSPRAGLPFRHALLAAVVAAIWGTNFVVMKWGIATLPPLFFATLRFAFAVFPAVLFLRRPTAPWGVLAAYGMLMGAGQFGLIILAINGRISPGLASLVVQTQVLFTIALSMWLTGERVRPWQGGAVALALAGIAVIAVHIDRATTVAGLVMTVAAALSWAGANVIARRSGGTGMVAYVVWSSAFAVPPLLLMSVLLEGWPAILAGLRHSGLATWAAVMWQASGNVVFGYAAWGWLLARHPAGTIAPVALLIPVFGMAASSWWLGESMPGWKIVAGCLVVGGLALNLSVTRWGAR